MFSDMPNLGKASIQMFLKAGIQSEAQLREMGSIAAFVAVKRAGCAPSLNLLWAIEGALTNRHWREVSKSDRTSLLFQLDDYEQGAESSVSCRVFIDTE